MCVCTYGVIERERNFVPDSDQSVRVNPWSSYRHVQFLVYYFLECRCDISGRGAAATAGHERVCVCARLLCVCLENEKKKLTTKQKQKQKHQRDTCRATSNHEQSLSTVDGRSTLSRLSFLSVPPSKIWNGIEAAILPFYFRTHTHTHTRFTICSTHTIHTGRFRSTLEFHLIDRGYSVSHWSRIRVAIPR